jgi:hypothetical protein
MYFTYTATNGKNGKVRAATPLQAAKKVIGSSAVLTAADVAQSRSVFQTEPDRNGKHIECTLIEVKQGNHPYKMPLWFAVLVALLALVFISGMFISLSGWIDRL